MIRIGVCCLVLKIALLTACSTSEPAGDWSIDAFNNEADFGEPDLRLDAPVVDSVPDPDQTLHDQTLSDGELGIADAKLVDGSALDAPAPDMSADMSVDGPTGTVSVWGYVSSSALPVLDGKGTIYLGLYGAFPPPIFPAAQVVINAADLSAQGNKLKFEFYNIVPGEYQLWGFLDDNLNAIGVVAAPDPGDLMTNAVISVKLTTPPVQQDIVFDEVMGASFPDGGVGGDGGTLGALSGKISSSVSGPGDGKGTIYLRLHTALPPAGEIAMVIVGNADLSATYKEAAYFFADVEAGNYYLSAFLDDNANADLIFGQHPDKGDLVIKSPIPLHLVGGQLNYQNVELDLVQP